jgi:hypothetical protein
MALFKCINYECSNYDVPIHNGNITYRMHHLALLADERFCTICNMEMQEVKRPDNCLNGFNISEMNNPDKDFTKNRGMGSKPIY